MDLELIEWLEGYINAYRGAVLIVSHDRRFLANTTDRVFWLDRGNLRTAPQGFAHFEQWSKAIELPPITADESSKNIAEFLKVGKSYGDKKILDGFNMRIKKKDRFGILGKNGAGKTSFLRMLTGEEKPDMGKIKMAKNMTFSYFDQKRSMLMHDKSIKDNLCDEGSDYLDVRGKSRHVCGYLKDFLFAPEDAWRSVSTLSGGQKNRLMLAKVLADPGSMLILDEPTNDLDMDTLDMLTGVLKSYEGTLFVVSHDRDFLDQVVTNMLVFEGDAVVEGIVGGYSDYMAWKKSQNTPKAVKDDKSAPKKDKKEAPKKEPIAFTFKLKHELDGLPKKIKALEKEVAELEEQINDPDLYTKDPEKFSVISSRFPAAKDELDTAELRWLELEEIKAHS